MANPDHLAILEEALAYKDITIWNKWLEQQRKSNHTFIPSLPNVDLTGADLREADFRRAKLSDANLREANLFKANLFGAHLNEAHLTGAHLHGAGLCEANLSWANLNQANLRGVDLRWANLHGANLVAADLTGADLSDADISRANLGGANLGNAKVYRTIISNVDFSAVQGLESVIHKGRSEITISTLYASGGNIPEVFLRGCGIPETMITFAKSLVGKAIEYFSAFISYSSADELFAKRLHNDLQGNGVRVWFAPEDLKTGDPLKQTIDEAVKMYDKLILVLSEDSIHSAYVRREFKSGLEKERQHNKLVLFPIRLDNSVFDTTEQWAYDLKERHIGDFRDWQNPLSYQAAFNRLLKDLNAKS